MIDALLEATLTQHPWFHRYVEQVHGLQMQTWLAVADSCLPVCGPGAGHVLLMLPLLVFCTLQSMAAEIDRKTREDDDRQRRRAAESRRAAALAARSTTPEPVPGRSHADIQTETFLEVLSDRAPEFEMGVQTDALLDRPPTPLFVPRPSGVDAVTQVADGDLFHFDFEVAPVLDVLVGE